MMCNSKQGKLLTVITVISSLILIVDSASLPECLTGGWKCGDGSCIAKEALCDGVKQCPRGEDERDCQRTTSCSSGYYECDYYYNCIPNYLVCDGHSDCFYGDDEVNCDYGYTPTTTEHMTTAKRMTTTDRMTTAKHMTTTDRMTTAKRMTTTDRMTTAKRMTTTDRMTTAKRMTTTDRMTTARPMTTTDRMTTAKRMTTTERMTTVGSYTTTRPSPPPSSCKNPFDLVGDRCVFVDPVTSATWNEARYICEAFDGDLVILDSIGFYGDLVQFINDKGLTARDYWVGANSASSGKWKWLSGTEVRMGTPLWAIFGTGSYTYEQEPRGTAAVDYCAYLDKTRFFYMDDYDCSELKAFICQVPTWKVSNANMTNIPKNTGIIEERVKEILAALKAEKH